MTKQEKLKLVFDFIADYISDDEVKEVSKIEIDTDEYTVTETEDNYKRAYTLMKKIDEIDRVEAIKKTAVREATNPLKEQLKKVKEEAKHNAETEKILEDKLFREGKPLSEIFKKRTGVTLDEHGKIAEVQVGPLKDYTTIKDVLTNSQVLSGEDKTEALKEINDRK